LPGQFVTVFGLAFPNGADGPAQILQRSFVVPIPALVVLKFLGPEPSPALWLVGHPTPFVCVPEATMHKDHLAPGREHQVRLAWKVPDVEAVPVAKRMCNLPNPPLWLRILAPDTRHPGTALLLCECVHATDAVTCRWRLILAPFHPKPMRLQAR
jgi:hypothetical protein